MQPTGEEFQLKEIIQASCFVAPVQPMTECFYQLITSHEQSASEDKRRCMASHIGLLLSLVRIEKCSETIKYKLKLVQFISSFLHHTVKSVLPRE